MSIEQRTAIRKLGLAVKNFILISQSCDNWSFRNKKTNAVLNIRY